MNQIVTEKLRERCNELQAKLDAAAKALEAYDLDIEWVTRGLPCKLDKLTQERDAANAACAEMRHALEYVHRWWDETGRDAGWHQSIGRKVDQALAHAKQIGL